MINVAEIVNDPDFAQSFTILRSIGSFQAGGWVESPRTTIQARGVIDVASSKDVRMLPEADRIGGEMIFYSTTEIHTTNTDQNGTSDLLVWRGDSYRVMQVNPYNDYGFNSAIAVRVSGK